MTQIIDKNCIDLLSSCDPGRLSFEEMKVRQKSFFSIHRKLHSEQ